jgi:hypothetical protein
MLHQSLLNGLPKALQWRSKVIVMVWKRGCNVFPFFAGPVFFLKEGTERSSFSHSRSYASAYKPAER